MTDEKHSPYKRSLNKQHSNVVNFLFIIQENLFEMLIRALLFDNFLDPPALVGQHVKRIHNRSGNSEDEKQLNHEETALSFERFDDIEGRNLLSYLLVGHHESIVAGSGSEVNDVPNNEDQTQKNDQNKGTCNHNGHSNSQGVLASLEKNL